MCARPAAATPAGSGPAASPSLASRSLLGGGGRPLGSGGAEGRSCGPQAGGGCGRGGGGAPRRPVGRRPAFRCPRRAPPGYTRAVGVAGRPRASGAVRSAADGSVRRGGGGEGGGNPPTLVRAPVFPGPASDKAAPFAPSWAPPVRRRPAAGRACGRLPRPWCPRGPGAAASSGGLRGRRFFGLPPSGLGPEWEGGGEWASGPLALPPGGQGGGRHGAPGPGGQPSAGGSHSSPAPLYLEPDPRAGPRWGPSSPWPSSRGAGRPGAAVRVSGQQLAGCGVSLSPPSVPWEVGALLRHAVPWGGRGSGGPAPPPTFSRPPSEPSPALPLVWGLGLWRRRVALAVGPVGEGAAQGPGEPVVGVRIRDAEHRSPFQEGRPRRLPVGPRRPDH